MNKKILETPRCYIRELTEADIAAEYELYDSPHMTDYIPPLDEPEREVSLCREYAERVYGVYGYGMWGVFDRDTDRLIGEAGLEPRTDTDRTKYPYDWMFDAHTAELGFCIAEDLWGQGYCSEVCRAILTYCREHFGIATVFARTEADNVVSVRVLESLGFTLYDPGDNDEPDSDFLLFYFTEK